MRPEGGIPDFEGRFQRFALDWLKRHPGLKEEEIEDRYNEMRSEWEQTPADWLDGEKPGDYFQKYNDSRELTALLSVCYRKGIQVPEPLYRRIEALGAEAVPALMELAGDGEQPEAARATALSLLADIGGEEALPLCAEILARAEAEGDAAEAAVRALKAAGSAAVPFLLERFEGASDWAADAMLDVLSGFPGDDRVYQLAVYRFLNAPDKRAMYAGFLARLGDARAIEPLTRVAEAADLTYYDYLEIANAIEELGGELERTREFYGDPDYEAMRFLE